MLMFMIQIFVIREYICTIVLKRFEHVKICSPILIHIRSHNTHTHTHRERERERERESLSIVINTSPRSHPSKKKLLFYIQITFVIIDHLISVPDEDCKQNSRRSITGDVHLSSLFMSKQVSFYCKETSEALEMNK